MSPENRVAIGTSTNLTSDEEVKGDIWGLGLTMYELITGELPIPYELLDYTTQGMKLIMNMVKTKDYHLFKKLDHPNKTIKNVVNAMLQGNPNERPDSIKLLNMLKNNKKVNFVSDTK
jgi:serine/threonine protein kinase